MSGPSEGEAGRNARHEVRCEASQKREVLWYARAAKDSDATLIARLDDTQLADSERKLSMGTKLYVGNLSYVTNEEALRAVFAEGGRQVRNVSIILDRETGRSRGFGFVQMASPEDAQAAMTALDGHELDGRPLRVKEAREREGGPEPRAREGGREGAREGVREGAREGMRRPESRPGGALPRSPGPRDRPPSRDPEPDRERRGPEPREFRGGEAPRPSPGGWADGPQDRDKAARGRSRGNQKKPRGGGGGDREWGDDDSDRRRGRGRGRDRDWRRDWDI
jgi:RNA recognition motif-containing protein